MRRVLFSTISLLALTTVSAMAADIPRAAPAYKAPPVLAPVFSWTGFYLGINGGYGWGSSDWSAFGEASPDGGMVGGTIGYNWQTGPWVFGLEGDIDWSDMRGGFANAACPLGCETRNSWLGTARGRIGWAFDRIMPYVTGGAAFGDIKASTPFGSQRDTNVGWTVGAGVEAALGLNWTAKVEYLHVDLGDVSCGALACGLPTNVDFTADIVRGGLNYKF